MSETAVPRLSRGHKFRYDDIRKTWVLLGPERLFLPDENAVEILKLVDGTNSVAAIANQLASRFDAPVEAISADVRTMLDDLAARGAIKL